MLRSTLNFLGGFTARLLFDLGQCAPTMYSINCAAINLSHPDVQVCAIRLYLQNGSDFCSLEKLLRSHLRECTSKAQCN